MDAQWWRQAVVYQIYPRSFADSNGDGVGDLNGILAKVGYLAELGVDAVWLSPFYPSALADGGYDVDDYRDVDPQLGNLDDFDRMVSAFRDQSIKVIVDIVPNHTSNRHHWFREALDGSPGSLARDRYIFRDGTGPDATLPPSNWQAAFGGPAWTAVGDGQWYLHLFTPEQPDLNWDNPEVHADFLQTLRFWGDRGVAGFRVDVAFALAKDMSLPLPSSAELGRGGPGSHPFYDRDEVHQIYAEWRTVFDSYQPPLMAVAEAWVPPHRRARYASPQGLGQAFNFDLLSAPWRPAQFREIISENLALALESGSSSTWVLSNHDVVRHATRYGLQSQAGHPNPPEELDFALGRGVQGPYDRQRGSSRARAASMLLLALPGSTYLYQGEELGLFEVSEIPDDRRQDPTFFRTNGTVMGRDGCRVPLPWSVDPPSFGFSTGPAHLPQPDWFGDHTVSSELNDPSSSLALYGRALNLRRMLLGEEALTWEESKPQVLHFTRPGGWHNFTNFGPTAVLRPDVEVLLSSQSLMDDTVPADTSIWYRQ
jgi:alpha-glucosidase